VPLATRPLALAPARARSRRAHIALSARTQGSRLFGIMRDVSEQYTASAMLRSLLLSTSFDLRVNAQNIQAASALLLLHDAVQADPEASFLAAAVQSSCNLLLGVVSNVIEMRRLERGELVLTLQTFSIADAIRDVIQSCGLGLQLGVAGLHWVNEDEAHLLPALVEARVLAFSAGACCASAHACAAGRREPHQPDRAKSGDKW